MAADTNQAISHFPVFCGTGGQCSHLQNYLDEPTDIVVLKMGNMKRYFLLLTSMPSVQQI